jgi:hypothetical protein
VNYCCTTALMYRISAARMAKPTIDPKTKATSSVFHLWATGQ